MGRVRVLAIWLVVTILCVLVPVAYATPPDPTYVTGLWDNADYDDVVILVTSSIGSTDTRTAGDLVRLLVVVTLVPPGERELPPAPALSPHPPRAPPAV
jgi:predicted membrane channel-forming protein YqfA (hemolysin III family)